MRNSPESYFLMFLCFAVSDGVGVGGEGSSLCSRVVELILPRSIEARLNAAVAPQPADHAAQLR